MNSFLRIHYSLNEQFSLSLSLSFLAMSNRRKKNFSPSEVNVNGYIRINLIEMVKTRDTRLEQIDYRLKRSLLLVLWVVLYFPVYLKSHINGLWNGRLEWQVHWIEKPLYDWAWFGPYSWLYIFLHAHTHTYCSSMLPHIFLVSELGMRWINESAVFHVSAAVWCSNHGIIFVLFTHAFNALCWCPFDFFILRS